jgi:hypothetical protein
MKPSRFQEIDTLWPEETWVSHSLHSFFCTWATPSWQHCWQGWEMLSADTQIPWGFTQRSFPKRDKAELWVESPEQKWSFHSFRCTDFLSSTHSRNVESDAKADFCAGLFRTLVRCVWTPEHSLEMQREHELKIAKASGEHYVYLLWDGMLAMFHFSIFRKSLKPSERCDRAWDPFMLFFLLSEWSWLQHLISYRSNDASSPSFLICPIKMKNEEIRDCCTFPLSMTLRALPWLCVGDMPLGSSQSL